MKQYLETVMIIDGNNLLHRHYNVQPKWMRVGDEPTFATYGFMRSIHSYSKKFDTQRFIVVFDAQGGTSKRKQLDGEYKSDRKRDDNFYEIFDPQMTRVKSILRSMKIPVITSSNAEADDVMGSIANYIESPNTRVIIVTTDHDLLQACSSDVYCLRNNKVKGDYLWNEVDVEKELGYHPFKLPLYWSLVGDPGDCVRSLLTPTKAKQVMERGVTDETTLLQSLRENGYDEDFTQLVRINLELVTLDYSHVPDLELPIETDFEGARLLYNQLKMNSLIKELDKLKESEYVKN